MAAVRMGRVLKRYRILGPHAGQDRVLCGRAFKGGEIAVSLSETEHASLARVLWYYQAEEVKDDGKRDVQTDQTGDVVYVGGEVRPDGEGIAPSSPTAGDAEGDGTATGVDEVGRVVSGGPGPTEGVGKIRLALLSLDPTVDGHWTSAGRPSLQAVQAAVGHPVTRAQVETALPGFTRKGMA
jgi:hypothetical protein